MSSWDATTTANVKAFMKVSGATLDTVIDELVSSVSRRAERYIGRDFEQTSRTETHDVGRRTRAIFLRNFPVASVTSVKNQIVGDFAASSALSDTLYDVDLETGRIYFRGSLVTGPNVIQVVYTGGIAATEPDLQAIEDLEMAVRRQVAYEYQRRLSPGTKNQRNTGRAIEGDNESAMNLLPFTKEILNTFRANHFTHSARLL